ncbi:rbcL [Symbiodinium natans]|uniref:RbcL protein n=1 Tax=Symbiodinium natans TaxID=878477 RepID=A0A812N4G3_9DINO|nr:rbcL [Symbiodinium natans]
MPRFAHSPSVGTWLASQTNKASCLRVQKPNMNPAAIRQAESVKVHAAEPQGLSTQGEEARDIREIEDVFGANLQAAETTKCGTPVIAEAAFSAAARPRPRPAAIFTDGESVRQGRPYKALLSKSHSFTPEAVWQRWYRKLRRAKEIAAVDKDVKRSRQSEIKHGRVAMLATMDYIDQQARGLPTLLGNARGNWKKQAHARDRQSCELAAGTRNQIQYLLACRPTASNACKVPCKDAVSEYACQKNVYADLEFVNDVGYLPDGTSPNTVNRPESSAADRRIAGFPLPRTSFVNSVPLNGSTARATMPLRQLDQRLWVPVLAPPCRLQHTLHQLRQLDQRLWVPVLAPPCRLQHTLHQLRQLDQRLWVPVLAPPCRLQHTLHQLRQLDQRLWVPVLAPPCRLQHTLHQLRQLDPRLWVPVLAPPCRLQHTLHQLRQLDQRLWVPVLAPPCRLQHTLHQLRQLDQRLWVPVLAPPCRLQHTLHQLRQLDQRLWVPVLAPPCRLQHTLHQLRQLDPPLPRMEGPSTDAYADLDYSNWDALVTQVITTFTEMFEALIE